MYENVIILIGIVNLVLMIFAFGILLSLLRSVKSPMPRSEPKQKGVVQQPMVSYVDEVMPPQAPQQQAPAPQPAPKPAEPEFKCKKCGKEFPDKKKLQRHIGMAHYADLEV